MSEREAAIQFRLQKAKGLLQEIALLQQFELHSTIINRLYYACFNATKALLLTKNLITKTHRGVANQLHQHFVAPGLFDADKAAFFRQLMQRREREEEDYGEAPEPGVYDTSRQVEKAFDYVAYVETLIPPAEL